MSTRSVVGVFTDKAKTRWKGRYVHSDGYPTGVGATLYSEYHRAFCGRLQVMIDLLLAERVGWSILVDCHFDLPAIWPYDPAKQNPVSYTARGETSDFATGEWVRSWDKETWCQWAYIFDPATCSLHIFRREWIWKAHTIINFEGPTPDWQKIEDSPDYIEPGLVQPW